MAGTDWTGIAAVIGQSGMFVLSLAGAIAYFVGPRRRSQDHHHDDDGSPGFNLPEEFKEFLEMRRQAEEEAAKKKPQQHNRRNRHDYTLVTRKAVA